MTETKKKQITNAPPPISPLPVGPVTTTPDRGTMTNKEYRAARGHDVLKPPQIGGVPQRNRAAGMPFNK